MEEARSNFPIDIRIISILAALLGAVLILLAVGLSYYLVFEDYPFTNTPLVNGNIIQTPTFFIMGLVVLTTSIGLMRLRIWGWWLAVAVGLMFIAFAISINAVRFLIGVPISGPIPLSYRQILTFENLIVPAVALYLVYRRKFFGKVTTISKVRLVGVFCFGLSPIIVMWVLYLLLLE